jgi:hypothetical protein
LQAGIKVKAGIDIDAQAEHAFVKNNPGAALVDAILSVGGYEGVTSTRPLE